MMAAPQVPIEVDAGTGAWSTDGLPMIYVPVHFFLNNHFAIEAELGVERYAAILYRSGYTSAWRWCEHESAEHGLRGEAVFRHYLSRLSQRGWARFTVEQLDVAAGRARVSLRHSIFNRQNSSGDYLFTGWFAGALDQILDSLGSPLRTHAVQTYHEGQLGATHGLFEVRPADPH